MFLNQISLKNYRKFYEKTLNFYSNNIIIFGDNATGKTTILEAIYVLSTTKNPKNSDLNEIIKEGENFFAVSGQINDEEKQKTMFVSFTNGAKKVKINGETIKKISDYINNFFVYYYQPLDSLKYSVLSQNRRTLFDAFISQNSDEYLKELILYKRILKEKNALLKSQNFDNTHNNVVLLEMYNEKIIKHTKTINKIRKTFTELINKKINKIHKMFSNYETAKIEYRPNVLSPETDYKKSIMADIATKSATIGPHKDDFLFMINEKNIASFCSQGQQKSFVLSLKIAMLEITNDIRKKCPILILDDAFSDLDEKRQNAIFEIVNKKCQLFISTTSLKQINKKIIENSQIIETKKGDGSDEWGIKK